jgi:hypothetical protein
VPWIAWVSVKVAYFLEGKGKRQLTRGCAPCAVAPGRMASSTLPLPSKVTVSRNRPTEIDLMLMGRFQTCNYSFAGLCGKHSLGCVEVAIGGRGGSRGRRTASGFSNVMRSSSGAADREDRSDADHDRTKKRSGRK